MKILSSLADRMLSRFVPSLTASAGVPCPPAFKKACSACRTTSSGQKVQLVKLCRYSGNVCQTVTCGACFSQTNCL